MAFQLRQRPTLSSFTKLCQKTNDRRELLYSVWLEYVRPVREPTKKSKHTDNICAAKGKLALREKKLGWQIKRKERSYYMWEIVEGPISRLVGS